MRALPLEKDLQEIDIYVIVSQISNEIFVWKAKHPNAYQSYKEHVYLKFQDTKDLFKQSETEEKFPKLYILETIVATKKEAFRHCVAWTRFFIERGYMSISSNTIQSYANDLLPETDELYQRIKNLTVSDALALDKLRVDGYRKRPAPARRVPKNKIKISVTESEYDHILKCAEENGLSMAKYCRNMVLEGRIVEADVPTLIRYIEELRGVKVILRQILYAIYQNGKYYPADMENIQQMVDKISADVIKMREETYENTKTLMKLLPK